MPGFIVGKSQLTALWDLKLLAHSAQVGELVDVEEPAAAVGVVHRLSLPSAASYTYPEREPAQRRLPTAVLAVLVVVGCTLAVLAGTNLSELWNSNTEAATLRARAETREDDASAAGDGMAGTTPTSVELGASAKEAGLQRRWQESKNKEEEEEEEDEVNKLRWRRQHARLAYLRSRGDL